MNTDWVQAIRQALEPTSQAAKKLRTPVLEFSSMIGEAVKNWSTIMHDSFRKLHEYIEEYGEVTQRFSAIMVELGWPPHEELFPEDVFNIVEIYDKFGPE